MRMRLLTKLILLFILVGGAAGCANDKEARQDAKVLSIYVEKVKADAVAFSDARDRVAKARTSTLNFLQASTLRTERDIQNVIATREVAQDKDWLAFFSALKKVPDLVSRQRQEEKDQDAQAAAELASAKGAVDVKSSRLTEASSALAALSEQPSKRDAAKFYLAFLKQVNAGLAKKQQDAISAANTSAEASISKSE